LLCACACESQPTSGQFSSAISRYEEGRYSAALAQSESVMRSENATTAAQGALIGAMSAYKLGQVDQAQRLARRAAEASDRATAGAALVLLADVQLVQKNPQEAAELYSKAADKLAGADAARARECAQQARDLATPQAQTTVVSVGKERENADVGDEARIAPAPQWAYQTPAKETVATLKGEAPPATTTTTPTPVATAVARAQTSPSNSSVSGKIFTIRAGSYSSKSAAQKRATALTKDLRRSKAPQARVDTIHTTTGEELYAVRIGTWSTRADAEKMRRAIALQGLAVGAIDPD